ncbi:MAG: response regulator, partial [Acidimicrobiales bacterium]
MVDSSDPAAERTTETDDLRADVHQLNNLLFVVLANCELLDRLIPESDAAHRHVDHIRSAATRAAAITRSLADDDRSSTPEPTEPVAAGTEVLVVDDEMSLQRLAQRILEPEGFSVAVAASGEEATAVLEQRPLIDLVLLDVGLKGDDGLDLLDWIIAHDPGLPVVVISGHDPG